MTSRLPASIRGWLPVAIAMAIVIALPSALFACPTCKDQLASDANSSGIVAGYFWSILLMLSMPIVILGSLGAYVVYQLSKADAKLPPNLARQPAAPVTTAADQEAVGV